jgi:hypothetical protein
MEGGVMGQLNSFCANCGHALAAESAFCVNCGAPVGRAAAAVAPPPTIPATTSTRRKPLFLLILVGLLLVLYSAIPPLSMAFGIRTTGTVTATEQVVNSSQDQMDYNYSIAYQFTTPDGKSHSGNYAMNRVYNIANLPSIGSTLSVAYLPGLPFVNSPAGKTSIGLSSVVTFALGLLLLILGARAGKPARRRN